MVFHAWKLVLHQGDVVKFLWMLLPALLVSAQENPSGSGGSSLFEISQVSLNLQESRQLVLLNPTGPDIKFRFTFNGTITPDMEFAADLVSPSGSSMAVQSPVNGLTFILPASSFTTIGTYHLTNIRLNRAGQTVAFSQPETAVIDVLDQLLVSRVEVRELSREELNDMGYIFNKEDYESVSFSLSLVMGAKEVPVDIALALPRYENSSYAPKVLGNPIKPLYVGMGQPRFPGNATGGVGGFKTQIESKREGYSLYSLLLIPGNFNYLKNHFSCAVVVLNSTPDGYDVKVRNMKATMRLPDPTRFGFPVSIQEELQKPVVQVGIDGEYGTNDDVNYIGPGEEASVDYLLLGEIEGMYDLSVRIAGEADLPQGLVPVESIAEGRVMVRSPEFIVTFEHPETVAVDEAYSLKMNFLNSGDTDLTGFSVSLDADALVGTTLLGNPTQTLATVAPGEEGSVTFSMKSDVPGEVVASYFKIEGGVTGSLQLEVGIAQSGEKLSPYVISFPADFYATFPSGLTPHLKRFCKKLLDFSQMSESELEPGLLVPSATMAKVLREHYVAASQSQTYGLSYEEALVYLFSATMQSAESDPAIDSLRRYFQSGGFLDLETSFADALSTAFSSRTTSEFLTFLSHENETVEGLFLAVVQGDGAFEVVDSLERVTGTDGRREIPFSGIFDLGGKGKLVWVSEADQVALRFSGGSQAFQIQVLASGEEILDRFLGQSAVPAGNSATVLFNPQTETLDMETLAGYSTFQTQAVVPKVFALSGVNQIPLRLRPGVDIFGRGVMFAFNKPVDLSSLEPLEEKVFINGLPVVDIVGQRDARFLTVGARMPLGPYRPITYRIEGVKAKDGSELGTLTGTVNPSPTFVGAVVSGRVVDHESIAAPRGKAMLFQQVKVPKNAWYVVHEVALDENGRYQFDFARADLYSDKLVDRMLGIGILLEDGRYEYESFVIQGAGQEIQADFAFNHLGSVEGYVFNEDGQPSVGADVFVQNQEHPDSGGSAVTDENGYYRVDRVEVGQVIVYSHGARLVGMNSGFLTFIDNPARVDIHLTEQSADLSGTVYLQDEEGGRTTLDGSLVVWQRDGSIPAVTEVRGMTVHYTDLGASDNDGHFNMSRVLAGTGTVYAVHPVYGVSQRQLINLGEGEDRDIEILYFENQPTYGTVRGQVVDGSGFAVNGAPIFYNSNAPIVETAADGSFEILGLPIPDSLYPISLSATNPDGSLAGQVFLNLSRDNAVIENVTIVVDGNKTLSGTVLQADGSPRAYAPVFYTTSDLYKSKILSYTDRNGYFSGEVHKTNTDIDVAVGSDRRIAHQNFFLPTSGTSDITLRERKQTDIEVRLLDGNGNPVVGKVHLKAERPNLDASGVGIPVYDIIYSVYTDTEGYVLLTEVNEGPYELWATSQLLGETIHIDGDLFANGDGTPLSYSLNFGQTELANLYGRVYDYDGESPAPEGSLVRATFRGVQATARVDAEGWYRFEQLTNSDTPERVTLLAYDDATNRYSSAAIELNQRLRYRHDLRLRGRGQLHVNVEHTDGRPAEFSSVRLTYLDVNYVPPPTPTEIDLAQLSASLRTLEDQVTIQQPVVTFADIPSVPFVVTAITGNGLVAVAQYSVPISGGEVDLTLTLEPESTISGTFLDHQDVPIVDAEILLSQGVQNLLQVLTESQSGSEGRFMFPNLPYRTYRLFGTDPESNMTATMEVTPTAFDPNPDVRLRLDPIGQLTGILYDQEGNPVPNGKVELRNQNAKLFTGTDESGRYRFHNIRLGDYTLIGQGELRNVKGTVPARLIHDDVDNVVDIHLDPTLDLDVTLHFADGRPAPGVQMFIGQYAGTAVEVVFTDENGVASFKELAGGGYWISALHPRTWDFVYDVVTLVPNETGLDQIDVFFDGRGGFEGYVLDSLGRPMTRPVDVFLQWEYQEREQNRTITTSPDGYFFIDRIHVGVEVNMWTYEPNTGEIARRMETLDTHDEMRNITLQTRAATFAEGRVQRINGDLVPYAQLSSRDPVNRFLEADNNGHFIFSPVLHGGSTIRFEDPNSSRSAVLLLNPEEEEGMLQPVRDMVVVLDGISNVSGTVTYEDGTVVRYGSVEAIHTARGERHRAVIQGNGAYLFQGLPLGEYQIRAYDELHDHYGPTQYINLVTDGGSLTHDISFEESFFLSGRVFAPNGVDPLENALVTIYRQNSKNQLRRLYFAKTGSDGFYNIDYLYPGSYVVEVVDTTHALNHTGYLYVVDRDRTHYNFVTATPSTVQGLVINPDNFFFTEGLIFVYQDGELIRNLRLNELGEFNIDDLSPGTYTFHATLLNGGMTIDQEVSLVAGNNVVTLTSPDTIELRARVVAPELAEKPFWASLENDQLKVRTKIIADGIMVFDQVPVNSEYNLRIGGAGAVKVMTIQSGTTDIDLGDIQMVSEPPLLAFADDGQTLALPYAPQISVSYDETITSLQPQTLRVWLNDEEISDQFTLNGDVIEADWDYFPLAAVFGENELRVLIYNDLSLPGQAIFTFHVDTDQATLLVDLKHGTLPVPGKVRFREGDWIHVDTEFGAVLVDNLPGQRVVYAESEGLGARADIDTGAAPTQKLSLKVLAYGGYRGVVYDQNGSPLAGAQIQIENHRETSAADGSYLFDYLPLGRHQIAAAYGDFEAFLTGPVLEISQQIIPGVDLPLVGFGSVVGQAVLADGITPLANARVHLTYLQSATIARLETYTDATGYFELDPVLMYDFRLNVYSEDGLQSGQFVGIVPSHGAQLDVVVTMEQAASAYGVVLDGSGNPVADIPVTVASYNNVFDTVTTGADGSFLFNNLPTGEYLDFEAEHFANKQYALVSSYVQPSGTNLGNLNLIADLAPQFTLFEFPDLMVVGRPGTANLRVEDDRRLDYLEYRYSGGYENVVRWELNDAAASRSGGFWFPDVVPAGIVNYEIVAVDVVGNETARTGTITILDDTFGPVVTVDSPQSGVVVDEGTLMTMAISMSDENGYGDVAVVWQDREIALSTNNHNDTRTLNFYAPGVAVSGLINVVIRAEDGLGNISETPFALDVQALTSMDAPLVAAEYPFDGLEIPFDLPGGTPLPILAGFEDADGLESMTVALDGQLLFSAPLQGGEDHLRFEWVIPESLQASSQFTLTISGQDVGGNSVSRDVTVHHLAGAEIWSAGKPLIAEQGDGRIHGGVHVLLGGEHTIDGRQTPSNFLVLGDAVVRQTATDIDEGRIASTHIDATGQVVVGPDASFDATAMGFWTKAPWQTENGRGSYAGLSSELAEISDLYGSFMRPTLPGTDRGGGAVHLSGDHVYVAGSVIADGLDRWRSSGGSVFLEGNQVGGYGHLRADGHFYPNTSTHESGSGGRIAVHGDFRGTMSVKPGMHAGAGTIYIRRPDSGEADGILEILRIAGNAEWARQRTGFIGFAGVVGEDIDVYYNQPVNSDVQDVAVIRGPVRFGPGFLDGMRIYVPDSFDQGVDLISQSDNTLYGEINADFPELFQGDRVLVGYKLDRIEVVEGGNLYLGEGLPDMPILLGQGLLGADDAVTLRGTDLTIENGGFFGSITLDQLTVEDGVQVLLNGELKAGQVHIQTGGLLRTLDGFVGAYMDVQADLITVDGAVKGDRGSWSDAGISNYDFYRDSHAGLGDHPDVDTYGSLYEADSAVISGISGGAPGRIRLVGEDLVINGTVSATGTGALAGGSVRLEGSTLSGSGTIAADGISNSSNGAGGGRVAVLVDQIDAFTGEVHAYGGGTATQSRGGAGTVYFRTADWPYGKLVIDNNGQPTPSDSTPLPGLGTQVAGAAVSGTDLSGNFPRFGGLRGLFVDIDGQDPVRIVDQDQTNLQLESAITLAEGESYSGLHILDILEVVGGGALYSQDPIRVLQALVINGGTINAEIQDQTSQTVTTLADGSGELSSDPGSQIYELDNYHLKVNFPMDVERISLINGASLTYTANLTATTIEVDGSDLVTAVLGDGTHLTAENLTLTNGSRWIPGVHNNVERKGYLLSAEISGTLTLDASSSIQTGVFEDGREPNQPMVWGTHTYDSRSHGGYGEADIDSGYRFSPLLGSYAKPTFYGGFDGGGRIHLQAGTLVLDGLISADSAMFGSGGSIWLETQTLQGSGTVSAVPTQSASGGMGGGRIAIYHQGTELPAGLELRTSGTVDIGVALQGYSGAGTIFIKDGDDVYGRMIIDQKSNTQTNNSSGLIRGRLSGVTALDRLEVGFGDEDGDPLIIRDREWTELPYGMAGLWVRTEIDGNSLEAQVLDNTHTALYLHNPSGTWPETVPPGTVLEFVFKIDTLELRNGAQFYTAAVLQADELISSGTLTNGIWARDLEGGIKSAVLSQDRFALVLEKPSYESVDLNLIDAELYLAKPITFNQINLQNSKILHFPTAHDFIDLLPYVHLEADQITMDAGSGIDADHVGIHPKIFSNPFPWADSLFFPFDMGNGNRSGGRIYVKTNHLSGGSLSADTDQAAKAGSIYIEADTLSGDIDLSASALDTFNGHGGRIALYVSDLTAANVSISTDGAQGPGTILTKTTGDTFGTLEIRQNNLVVGQNHVVILPAFAPTTLAVGSTLTYDAASDQSLLTVPTTLLDRPRDLTGYHLAFNEDFVNLHRIIDARLGTDSERTEFTLEGEVSSVSAGDLVQPVLVVDDLQLDLGISLEPSHLKVIYGEIYEAGYVFTDGSGNFRNAPLTADGNLTLDNYHMTINAPINYNQLELRNGAAVTVNAPEVSGTTAQLGSLQIIDGTLTLAQAGDGETPLLIADTVSVLKGHLAADHILVNGSLNVGVEGVVSAQVPVTVNPVWSDGRQISDTFSIYQGFGGNRLNNASIRFENEEPFGSFKRPWLVPLGQKHLRIQAENLVVDGVMTPDGTLGGGAGALLIETNALSGTGHVHVDSVGGYAGQAWGGGRLAVYADDLSGWSGELSAVGQENTAEAKSRSGVGTVFVKTATSTYGDLHIEGYDKELVEGTTQLPSFESFLVDAQTQISAGTITLAEPWFAPDIAGIHLAFDPGDGEHLFEVVANTVDSLTVDGDLSALVPGTVVRPVLLLDQLQVSQGGSFRFKGEVRPQSDLVLSSTDQVAGKIWAENLQLPTPVLNLDGTALTLALGETNITEIVVDGGVLGIDQPLTLNSLTLQNQAQLTHSALYPSKWQYYPEQRGIHLTVNQLTVDESSSVDVGGKGYPTSALDFVNGVDPDSSTFNNYHAGYGIGTSGKPYGSPFMPVHPAAGKGAGMIYIEADWVTLDGHISADGYIGGSVFLNVGTLEGLGRVSADGGIKNGTYYGGGGRVAVHYDNHRLLNRIPSAVTPQKEGATTMMGAGTVYLRDKAKAYGDLYIYNDDQSGRDIYPTPIRGIGSFSLDTVPTDASVISIPGGSLPTSVTGVYLVDDATGETYTVVSHTENTLTLDRPVSPVPAIGAAFHGRLPVENLYVQAAQVTFTDEFTGTQFNELDVAPPVIQQVTVSPFAQGVLDGGAPFTVVVEASDNVGLDHAEALFNGETQSLNGAGPFRFNFTAPSPAETRVYALEIQVFDAQNNGSGQVLNISVLPADSEGPVLILNAPTEFSSLAGDGDFVVDFVVTDNRGLQEVVITFDGVDYPQTFEGYPTNLADQSTLTVPHMIGNRTSSLTLSAVDSAGNAETRTISLDLVDETAPEPVSGVLWNADATSIFLSWQASADSDGDLDHYLVLVDGVEPGVLVPMTTLDYTATDLSPETDYLITVVAVDQSGNRGPAVPVLATTNGLAGAAMPMPSAMYTFDELNTGLLPYFDGSSQQVTLPATPSPVHLAEGLTFATWVNIPVGTSRSAHVLFSMTQQGSSQVFEVMAESSRIRFLFKPSDLDSQRTLYANGVSMFDGRWHRVVAVADVTANQFKVYVDGQLKGTYNQTFNADSFQYDSHNYFQLGNNRYNQRLQGQMFRAQLRREAWSEAQVQADFQALGTASLLTPDDESLTARWFELGDSGTELFDFSGNGYLPTLASDQYQAASVPVSSAAETLFGGTWDLNGAYAGPDPGFGSHLVLAGSGLTLPLIPGWAPGSGASIAMVLEPELNGTEQVIFEDAASGVILSVDSGNYLRLEKGGESILSAAPLAGTSRVVLNLSGTAQLYLDGALVGTINQDATPDWGSSAPSLGQGTSYGTYSGSIDDVLIWNRTLSAANVTQLFAGYQNGDRVHQIFEDQFGPTPVDQVTWTDQGSQTLLQWTASPNHDGDLAGYDIVVENGAAYRANAAATSYSVPSPVAGSSAWIDIYAVDQNENRGEARRILISAPFSNPAVGSLPAAADHFEFDQSNGSAALMNFDGSNYFEAKNGSDIFRRKSGITLAFWVRMDETSSGLQYLFYTSTQSANSARFTLYASNGKLSFACKPGDAGTYTVSGTKDLRDGAWHRVVSTVDPASDRMVLFIDGVQDAVRQGIGNLALTSDEPGTSVYLGSRYSGGYRFKGRFYDVQVWEKPWSDAIVATDYLGGVGLSQLDSDLLPERDLIAHWKMSELVDGVLVDETGSLVAKAIPSFQNTIVALPGGSASDLFDPNQILTTATDTGNVGSAALFQGSSQETTFTGWDPAAGFTLSGMYNLDGDPASQKRDNLLLAGDNGVSLLWSMDQHLRLQIDGVTVLDSYQAPQPGSYRHVVATWDPSGDAALYLDGLMVDKAVGVPAPAGTPTAWVLGGLRDFPGKTFTGKLDHFVVWSQVLSFEQINGLAQILSGGQTFVDHYPDVFVPAAPTVMDAVASDNAVQISGFQTSDPEVAEIRVYLDGSLNNTLTSGDNLFSITGLTPQTSYDVAVSYRDAAGNESALLSKNVTTQPSAGSGSATGDPALAWNFEGIGGSGPKLYFDQNSKATISDTDFLAGAESLTTAVWVKLPSDIDGTQRDVVYISEASDTRYPRLNIQIRNSLVTYVVSNNDASQVYVNSSAIYLGDDRWHRIVAVSDFLNQSHGLYVDGVLLKNMTSTSIPAEAMAVTPAATASLGSDEGTYSRLRGTVYDLQMWDQVWSQDDIEADLGSAYTRVDQRPGTSLIAANLRAHWPLDEASGTLLADATGNGADAVLDNALTRVDHLNPLTNVPAAFGSEAMDVTDLGVDVFSSGSALRGVGRGFGRVPQQASWSALSAQTYTMRYQRAPGSNDMQTLLDQHSGNQGFRLSVGSDGLLHLQLADLDMVSTTTLAGGTAYDIAVMLDENGDAALYLDGALQARESLIGKGWSFVDADLAVGGADALVHRSLNGFIDDLALWDRALTASEVFGLHENGMPQPPAKQDLRDVEGSEPSDNAVADATLPELGGYDADQVLEVRDHEEFLDGYRSDQALWVRNGKIVVRGRLEVKALFLTENSTLTVAPEADGSFAPIELVVAGDLVIDADSVIDLTGRGRIDLPESFNAAHGGFASQERGQVYGSPVFPTSLGGGQGGGGAVLITAKNLRLSGDILADGIGFAAGGSVLARLETFRGDGLISVAGGREGDDLGGGGRVAVYFSERWTFTGEIFTGEQTTGSLIVGRLGEDALRIGNGYLNNDLTQIQPINLPADREITPQQILFEQRSSQGTRLEITSDSDLSVYNGLWFRGGEQTRRILHLSPLGSGRWIMQLEGPLELNGQNGSFVLKSPDNIQVYDADNSILMEMKEP